MGSEGGRRGRLLAHVRRHAVAYLALFVALGGVSYAAIPDSGGVVHGCYDTTNQLNGASPLYVIDTSTTPSCPNGRASQMTALDWNAQGVPGPTGQQGPQGPSGPSGPSGKSNPLDEGPGALKNPPTGRAVGGGDPGAAATLGVPLVKQLVRGAFHKCHLTGPGDHPMHCSFSGQVTCPKKYPVAINGDWELWTDYGGQHHDVTQLVKTWDGLTITELYDTRTAGRTRGGSQGWTSAIATTDFSGYSEMWFAQPPVTALLQYRTWVLCGKKTARKVLGLPRLTR